MTTTKEKPICQGRIVGSAISAPCSRQARWTVVRTDQHDTYKFQNRTAYVDHTWVVAKGDQFCKEHAYDTEYFANIQERTKQAEYCWTLQLRQYHGSLLSVHRSRTGAIITAQAGSCNGAWRKVSASAYYCDCDTQHMIMKRSLQA